MNKRPITIPTGFGKTTPNTKQKNNTVYLKGMYGNKEKVLRLSDADIKKRGIKVGIKATILTYDGIITVFYVKSIERVPLISKSLY